MGGDAGPAVTVPAAGQLTAQADLILVGDARSIDAPAGTTVRHASAVIRPEDSLNTVLRVKRDASMRRALEMLKDVGASLIGLPGVVVKSQGGADHIGFQSAIEQAIREVDSAIPQKVADHYRTR